MATVELKSISELFGLQFFIPSYQRGYRWTTVQVRELLEDLYDFSDDNKREDDDYYCLQPVIVKGRGEQWELVDGQQRLTAIWLLSALYYCSNRDDEINLEHQKYELEYEGKPIFTELFSLISKYVQDDTMPALIKHLDAYKEKSIDSTIGNNTNSIVGDFTAVNLLEVNVTQNMSFIERVKEITKRLMEDLEHNSFSGVEVLRELSKVSEEKELLMPIVFTGVLKTDGTVGTIEYGFSHTPQVWIDCQIVDEIDSEDQEKGLMISWDTRKGAIKESIVTEMFESFTETIRILGIKHSEEWKNQLEIIVPSASKKKVICERNKGITNQSRIQQRFVKYAKKNSNKTAVIDAVETVTYGYIGKRKR